VRGWFEGQGFTEVETPALQVSPGNEAHLHAFATEAIGNSGARSALLPAHLAGSSPPRSCWRPGRAAASSNWARVWRNRERGPLHHPEFTMLEWYRAEESLRRDHGRLRLAPRLG
jgi:lysyl-tRNA synthetase class 2